MFDVIIIGAGVAGISCAVQLKRLGLKPLIIEKSGFVGGLIRNAGFIENYPGLKAPVNGLEFAARLEKMIENFALDLVFTEVISFTETSQEVTILTSEGPFVAPWAVFAAGTSPKPPPVEFSGVSCIFEPVKLKGSSGDRLAILGSGEAGCDYAISLSEKGFDVTMLVRRDILTARGVLKDRVYASEKIKVIHNFSILKGYEEGVLKYISGETPGLSLLLEFQHIILALGRTGEGEKYGLKSIKGVETNFKRIYIAGDAARGSLGQLAMAAGDGIRCAQIIAEML
ncbi:NAD(P)/FAD-dependent oxidoreductase [Myxococcota bacterium]|nr:NAD(P)/FAD-dependent oxidoreductase [Myxococcota bacterium]MBU1383163.1 NAD(P)/FAD-dependent oxidoreductase [Myxococcota bacterium]MBU1497201.1 NAD(P)/FAD-dependent oxidoreductase [Myxococcota bacterium]